MSISDQSYSQTPPTLLIQNSRRSICLLSTLRFLNASHVFRNSPFLGQKVKKSTKLRDTRYIKNWLNRIPPPNVEIIELSKLGRLLFEKDKLLVKFRPTWLNLESTLGSVIIIYGYTWSWGVNVSPKANTVDTVRQRLQTTLLWSSLRVIKYHTGNTSGACIDVSNRRNHESVSSISIRRNVASLKGRICWSLPSPIFLNPRFLENLTEMATPMAQEIIKLNRRIHFSGFIYY